ncbi:MAG: site-2 protease family protein [Candidatus Nanoarchaeia archaeon]|jgi:membrane-associated protease RseP (regulator of RpoE activity)
MNWELITALIIYSIVGLIIFFNRKRFEWIQGLILGYRTKRPLAWMDFLKPRNFFWKIYSTICIPIGFYFMPQLVYMLGVKAFEILTSPGAGAGVAVVIPGLRIPGSPIYIPIFQGIIAICVMIIVHEMAHGIISKSEGITVKNAGFGMFLVFPLFFVEPDEKKLVKSSKLSRLRMISAGAGTNIILAFVVLGLLTVTMIPFMSDNSVYAGLTITGTIEGYPAAAANMANDLVITGINGVETLNLTDFNTALMSYSPGEGIVINTDGGDYAIITANNPSNDSLPYVGVYLENNVDFSAEAKLFYGESVLAIISFVYETLLWVAFLNLSIGIMNLLPIWGLDGSKMLYDLLSYVMKERRAQTIVSIISSICIGLLVINIAPFFIGLFT